MSATKLLQLERQRTSPRNSDRVCSAAPDFSGSFSAWQPREQQVSELINEQTHSEVISTTSSSSLTYFISLRPEISYPAFDWIDPSHHVDLFIPWPHNEFSLIHLRK
ncbi:hypothetical protein EON64_15580 [archaeon]|nr:MAG: hypothetical protein EON64_15580 [archaeon]